MAEASGMKGAEQRAKATAANTFATGTHEHRD